MPKADGKLVTMSRLKGSIGLVKNCKGILDCSQPSIFSFFYSSLNAWLQLEENWTPVQNMSGYGSFG